MDFIVPGQAPFLNAEGAVIAPSEALAERYREKFRRFVEGIIPLMVMSEGEVRMPSIESNGCMMKIQDLREDLAQFRERYRQTSFNTEQVDQAFSTALRHSILTVTGKVIPFVSMEVSQRTGAIISQWGQELFAAISASTQQLNAPLGSYSQQLVELESRSTARRSTKEVGSGGGK